MNDYKRPMGQRIKERRKLLGITQERASEALGISVKHFSEVERGLTGLSVENLVNLSELLGVTLDYLIKGDRENKPDKLSFSLENIPKEKIGLLCELLNTGLKLCSSCGESPCENSVEK